MNLLVQTKEFEDKISNLEEEVGLCQKDNAELQSQRQNLKEEVKALEKENKNVKEDLRQMEREKTSLESDLNFKVCSLPKNLKKDTLIIITLINDSKYDKLIKYVYLKNW